MHKNWQCWHDTIIVHSSFNLKQYDEHAFTSQLMQVAESQIYFHWKLCKHDNIVSLVYYSKSPEVPAVVYSKTITKPFRI